MMTYEEIMESAKKLYQASATVSSISGARQAAATAASLLYYMAKLHVNEAEHKLKGVALDEPPLPDDVADILPTD